MISLRFLSLEREEPGAYAEIGLWLYTSMRLWPLPGRMVHCVPAALKIIGRPGWDTYCTGAEGLPDEYETREEESRDDREYLSLP